jgi:hypothetical protein
MCLNVVVDGLLTVELESRRGDGVRSCFIPACFATLACQAENLRLCAPAVRWLGRVRCRVSTGMGPTATKKCTITTYVTLLCKTLLIMHIFTDRVTHSVHTL